MGSPKLERLLQIFIDSGAFLSSETPDFRLASGAKSRFYIDCRLALSFPEARQLAGELVCDRLNLADFDAVGGLVLGAYPVALEISDACYRQTGKSLRVFVVRKEPKQHGLKKHIEGKVNPGDRVLIVDDVVTTGDSTIQAIQKSKEAGLEVLQSYALIDRQEGARENIEVHTPFNALCTLNDFRAFGETFAPFRGPS